MDRGIADVIGYLSLCGLQVPRHAEATATAFRYNRKTFIAPYWEAIFRQDRERKQDQHEAEATGRVMADTYARLGYQLIELPKVSVNERMAFIVDYLNDK